MIRPSARAKHPTLPTSSRNQRAFLYVTALGLCGSLIGCGNGALNSASTTSKAALIGKIYGGQNPVAGATLQLYAAGATGYSAAPTQLLTKTVTSASDGSFSITGDYTCPANAQVYLVATGGNPGLSPSTLSNGNLALMTGLGACSNLSSSTSLTVNELTTVATVWSLAHFMSTSISTGGLSVNISTSATNTVGLANAFAIIPELVNTANGTTPGSALPVNATLTSAELNTLADALAACVNSGGGAAGDTTLCGQLFTATNTTSSNSNAPQDTITAALNLARNPTLNPSTIFGLAASGAAFQPTLLSAPQNFTVAITYSGGGLNAPAAIAADASGNVWTANANSTLTELSPLGAALSTAAGITGGGLNAPSALAIDGSGNVWVTNRSGNSVSVFNSSGSPLAASPVTGGGLSSPTSVAIDEDGTGWITNAGNNSLSAISSAFTALSPSGGFTGAGLNQPTSIAINPH